MLVVKAKFRALDGFCFSCLLPIRDEYRPEQHNDRQGVITCEFEG